MAREARVSGPLDLDEIVRSWQEYEDISPLPLIAEIRRLTAENEALRDKQADLNMAWAESLADAYVERDALQARIDAALALCDNDHDDCFQLVDGVRAALTGSTP